MPKLLCFAFCILQAITAFSVSKSVIRVNLCDIASSFIPEGTHLQNQNQENFTIRTNAVLVTVDTVVRDEKGNFIGDLRSDDFAVYDNGVSQNVTFFSREQLPLAVALVVDRSASVQPYLQQVRNAALTVLQHLNAEDGVALFSFDVKPYQLTELTQDREKLAQMISKIPRGTATNICDALFDAARYLYSSARNRRRAIILVSDNRQSFPSTHSLSQTLQQMLESSVTLYNLKTGGRNPAISTYDGMSQKATPNDRRSIAWVAAETGGEVLDAVTPENLPTALASAITNAKSGYILGFTPSSQSKEGSYHRLAVRLKSAQRCQGCRVQARSGYYVGSQMPAHFQNALRGIDSQHPPSMKPLTDLEALIAQNVILVARDDSSELAEIPFGIKASDIKDANNKPLIKIDLQFALSNIVLKMVANQHVGRLRITSFYLDSAGHPLGGNWQVMDLHLSEDTYQKLIQSGISFSTTVPRRVQKQLIKVVVYDPLSEKIGSKLVRIE